jgi:hypothetical protein
MADGCTLHSEVTGIGRTAKKFQIEQARLTLIETTALGAMTAVEQSLQLRNQQRQNDLLYLRDQLQQLGPDAPVQHSVLEVPLERSIQDAQSALASAQNSSDPIATINAMKELEKAESAYCKAKGVSQLARSVAKLGRDQFEAQQWVAAKDSQESASKLKLMAADLDRLLLVCAD